VDDAVWTSTLGAGASIRGTSKKYEWLARQATEVWAGNKHVADWASAAGARVVRWVPTTVPVPPLLHNDHREGDLLVWVGTPSTGPYVERLLHDLRDSLRGWRVRIVGARIVAPAEVEVTQCDWSPEAEADALNRASVGLYPLDVSHPGTIGKSALKSVLFMAHGIPLIATPTPSNMDVMTHGREGFFASVRRSGVSTLRSYGTRRNVERWVPEAINTHWPISTAEPGVLSCATPSSSFCPVDPRHPGSIESRCRSGSAPHTLWQAEAIPVIPALSRPPV
jgi:hypothetical protein